jgi:ABC-type multidrug transport system permease subunit
MEKSLWKSKTTYAAMVQWLVVVVSWITGEVEFWTVIADFVAMLGVIFYRKELGTNLRNILNGYFSKVAWLKDGVFWTVLVGILGSVTAWLTGVIELPAMLIAVATALVGFFVRTGSTPETG